MPVRSSSRAWAGAVAIAALALTGCATEGPSPPRWANVATYPPEGEGGNAGLLEGRISEVEPCVVVESPEGDRFVPVFPEDAVGEADGLPTFDGIVLRDGVRLSLGGGTASTAPENATMPDGCDGAIWVVSQ